MFLISDGFDSFDQLFWTISLDWDLSDVFLKIRLGWGHLGGRPQKWSAIFIPCQGYILLTWLPTTDVDLDAQHWQWLSGFSTSSLLFSLPLSDCRNEERHLDCASWEVRHSATCLRDTVSPYGFFLFLVSLIFLMEGLICNGQILQAICDQCNLTDLGLFNPSLILLFFLIFILLISAYNVWVISPPFPHPFLTPLTPWYPAETILPLSLILLKRECKQ
jgi:hypothetical protein